jgi:hypothetical protein
LSSLSVFSSAAAALSGQKSAAQSLLVKKTSSRLQTPRAMQSASASPTSLSLA